MQVGKIKRWYRLAASTAVAGEYPSVTEVLGGTALAQTSANRKPAAATSANGLPVATFDGTDMWLQTLQAGNNGTAKWFVALRAKPASFGAAQRLYGCRSAGGASTNRADVNLNTDGSLALLVFVSGFNGRSYTTPASALAAATWAHVYVIFDNSKTAECDTDGLTADAKVRIAVGNTFLALTAADIGSGGAVTALLAATGTAILGASTDSDTPTSPFLNNGQFGPNLFNGDDSLTAAELAALVAFEAPA